MLNSVNSSSISARIAEGFAGNDDTAALLGGMIESGRMPHAFIIEGEDGLGKTTLAHIIAEGAMCECSQRLSGKCAHCRKLKADIHPDLVYVHGSGKTNSISIDTIREMRRECMIAPNEAARRVFLLEDCDNMLAPAQNAFLKIFEEAPPHVVFIMTCKSAMSLLITIRSRGTILTLHPVSQNEAEAYLRRRLSEIDAVRLKEAVLRSGGNIGKALMLLESDEVRQQADRAALIAEKIINMAAFGSELELAAECAAIGRDRQLANEVCEQLEASVRQALTISAGASDMLNAPSQAISRYGMTHSMDSLIVCLDYLEQLKAALKLNISMPLFNTRLAIILQRR